MKAPKNSNHKYLLYLYSKVDSYLANNKNAQINLPDIIVSFCVVVEKILKIKLHKKNPVLIFDISKTKDNDSLVSIILKKEKDIETIRIEEIINRFRLVNPSVFSDEEFLALIDVYHLRNRFIHGHKPDDDVSFEVDDVVKKLGTLWEKVSILATELLGKNNIKSSRPKEKYTNDELEQVLEDEVRKKIQLTIGESFPFIEFISSPYISQPLPDWIPMSTIAGMAKQCPRCDSYEFYQDESNTNVLKLSSLNNFSMTFSDLYRCRRCSLELTKKEYDIAKKLKKIPDANL